MQVKGILFDFDGTLVKSNELKTNAFYEITKHIKGSADLLDDLFANQPHLDRSGLLTKVSDLSDQNTARDLIDQYTQWVDNAMKSVEKVAGSVEFLEEMTKKNIPMAVCSATPEAHIERAVQYAGIDQYFTDILGGPHSKSDGARAILEKWSLTTDDIVFIGDTENDRSAAEKLNCRFIAIEGSFNNFTKEPEESVASYRDLKLTV